MVVDEDEEEEEEIEEAIKSEVVRDLNGEYIVVVVVIFSTPQLSMLIA